MIRCPGSSREDTEFQPGHSLEAVDLRNPRLVRVASVASVEVRMLMFSVCALLHSLEFEGLTPGFRQPSV
jgi:hypothetical protein